MPALIIENLVKKYKEKKIIENLSFFVKKGEFFIITGPNGSGKTTIVKTLAGIINKTAGKVLIFNKDINKYKTKELALKIDFVAQQNFLDFSFYVKEIVLMGRFPHMNFLGMEKQKDIDIAEESMVFTGVDNLKNRAMESLSGGEQQRVFIARSICQRSEIMILDEPTASLDISHQIRIMELLKKLKNKNRITIIMVSHDLNLASMYADRILLLKHGKIIKTGKPENVLKKDILEDVYDCRLYVDKTPSGNPRIIPAPLS